MFKMVLIAKGYKLMSLKILNSLIYRKNFFRVAFSLYMSLGVILTLQAQEDEKNSLDLKINGIEMKVFAYRPPNCQNPSILFVFHGIKRTAKKYRNRAMDIAKEACLTVFAPKFDKKRFPNWRYQRGGVIHKDKVQKRSEWTGSFVRELIDWAKREVNTKNPKIYLFGHSAGAQFLSRIAAYTALLDVERIVIANPSTYVMPTTDEIAPYGFGNLFSEFEAHAQLKTEDTGKKNLHDNKAAKRQGKNRLERGRNVFQQAQAFAHKKGWAFNWKLVEVPNVGHSSKDMLNAKEFYKALGLDAKIHIPTPIQQNQ